MKDLQERASQSKFREIGSKRKNNKIEAKRGKDFINAL